MDSSALHVAWRSVSWPSLGGRSSPVWLHGKQASMRREEFSGVLGSQSLGHMTAALGLYTPSIGARL